MASSPLLLSLVLLLAASVDGLLPVARGDAAGEQGLKHIHMYMHETPAGPNATVITAVPSRPGGDTTFGMIQLLDNELRDGPDSSSSSLLGRFQGIAAFAGLVSPPGMQSAISFVFAAGEHAGSTLVMVGTVLSFEGDYERAVVGGTGAFRLARGYCVMRIMSKSNPTPESAGYEVNLFLKMDA